MKIALGAARFGMDYGISDNRAKVARSEVYEILDKAASEGIDTIQTAHGYGESEKVIGSFLETKKNKFNIISKLPTCDRDEVANLFGESLKNLGVDELYGYLIHSFESYKNDKGIWDELCKLKKEGKVKKIGFSLYYPSEVEELFDRKISVDMVQIPCSVLDQRFFPYLELLKERGVEVHARSIFLQGLFFKEPADIPEQLRGVSGKLEALREISRNTGIDLEVLCLLFVTLNDHIDKVVIGMGSIEHLENNIKAFDQNERVRAIYGDLLSLRESDEDILVPFRWTVKG